MDSTQENAQRLPNGETVHVAAGEILALAGNPIDRLFMPLNCMLGAFMPGPRGGVDIALMSPGTILGAEVTFGMDKFVYSVVARTPGRVVAMDRSVVHNADPKLQRRLHVAHRQMLHEILDSSYAASKTTVATRIARWILRASTSAGPGWIEVTHGGISSSLGIRRPSVTAALQDLHATGVVEVRRAAIIVRDRSRLEVNIPSIPSLDISD